MQASVVEGSDEVEGSSLVEVPCMVEGPGTVERQGTVQRSGVEAATLVAILRAAKAPPAVADARVPPTRIKKRRWSPRLPEGV
jgi:hypothetical protein